MCVISIFLLHFIPNSLSTSWFPPPMHSKMAAITLQSGIFRLQTLSGLSHTAPPTATAHRRLCSRSLDILLIVTASLSGCLETSSDSFCHNITLNSLKQTWSVFFPLLSLLTKEVLLRSSGVAGTSLRKTTIFYK